MNRHIRKEVAVKLAAAVLALSGCTEAETSHEHRFD